MKVYFYIFLSLLLIIVILVIGEGNVVAGDTFSVNASNLEGEKGLAIVSAYVPFLNTTNGYCSSGSCSSHGVNAVSEWLSPTSFMSNPEIVPPYDPTPGSGYALSTPFGVGQGLPSAWLTTLSSDGDNPLTAPDSSVREKFIDQIVIKYTESSNFVQNFRSQFSFGDSWEYEGDGTITRSTTSSCSSDASSCLTLIDHRLEQGDQDMEGSVGTKDIRQAFQQAFSATSGINTTSNPGISEGEIVGIGQLIEQVSSFFYSCLNCTITTKPPEKLPYQPWPFDPPITSIIHADSARQTIWSENSP